MGNKNHAPVAGTLESISPKIWNTEFTVGHMGAKKRTDGPARIAKFHVRENCTPSTASVCPSMTTLQKLPLVAQILAVLSVEPVAAVAPFGEKFTEVTSPQ
mmetsp:Transcript_145116/g.255804  ORF Transcript_145116/g.255804 Transcript_145116/m.255804 type:complete len:101 (+) Transcript_145116:299-601(+)